MPVDTSVQDPNISFNSDQIEELIEQDNENHNISEKSSSHPNDNMGLVMNIPVNIQIILGSCCMKISDLVNLSKGDVITLDRRVGETIDITVNNQKIAKGEITIMEDDDTRFGVRIIEIINSN